MTVTDRLKQIDKELTIVIIKYNKSRDVFKNKWLKKINTLLDSRIQLMTEK